MGSGTKLHTPDGFYSGYFTGSAEIGFALIVLQDGILVGADAAGVKFDGSYKLNDRQDSYEGRVRVEAPPGGNLVQGIASGPSGLTYEVKISLPLNFSTQPFIRIETPYGPVNAKFVKLRNLT